MPWAALLVDQMVVLMVDGWETNLENRKAYSAVDDSVDSMENEKVALWEGGQAVLRVE